MLGDAGDNHRPLLSLPKLGLLLLDDAAALLLGQVLHQVAHQLHLDAEALGHLLLGEGPPGGQRDDPEASGCVQLA